jgi:starch-binding outer membrane protein, SusD/RagB family
MHLKYHNLLPLAIFIFLLASCKKYLDEKPDKEMTVPATLTDLQRLLDNYGIMNAAFPYSGELLADNYYLTTADWSSLSNTTLKNYYVWQKDDQSTAEWATTYRVVFYANVVLDELAKMEPGTKDSATVNSIKGEALFFRGFAHYALCQLFAPPYDSATAAGKMGIPLRLSSDFTLPSVRATVEQSYRQVVDDLKRAALLLPAAQPSVNRPSAAAAYAALARIYLATGAYAKASFYADSSLQLYRSLIDFNTLNAAAAIPIARFNPEVLFPAVSTAPSNLSPSRAKVDTVLYAAYADDDLRKKIFFKTNSNRSVAFKGSYDGSNNGAVFSGLTTSEMYMTKAEALARLGQTEAAMEALNTLLRKRWKEGSFTPLSAPGAAEALDKILQERRKELCFRGLRWSDLRRLNKESRFATTLYRLLNNQTYTLLPGSSGYTLLIPKAVIDLSGMPQNQ